MYLALVLQELRPVFRAPDTIADLPTGIMSVWLHASGRLTRARPADTLLPASITHALTMAIDSLSRLGGIGTVLPPLPADSVELRLVLHSAAQRTALSVPFLQVALPPTYFEFEVEKPALARPGNPSPLYPPALRDSHIEGEVLVQFVVDTMGRADMRTFRLLGPARVYREFAVAVIETLPRMRFTPAERRGCKVRQLVQLPFAFKLRWD
jgi:TonB family protein